MHRNPRPYGRGTPQNQEKEHTGRFTSAGLLQDLKRARYSMAFWHADYEEAGSARLWLAQNGTMVSTMGNDEARSTQLSCQVKIAC